MAGQAADVFISYEAEDRARVLPLLAGREAERFGVSWDTHIGGDAHWRDNLHDHLNVAKCALDMWAKASIWHDDNLVFGKARGAERRRVYAWVYLGRVDPPIGFGEAHAISLNCWHGNRSDLRFLALADAIGKYFTALLQALRG